MARGWRMVMEDMVAPFIADGRLVRVIGRLEPAALRHHLYYPNRRHLPGVRSLLEELRANSHHSRRMRHPHLGHRL